MQYRTYGKLGYQVSALGFGAMRLPMTPDGQHVDHDAAVPLLRRGFDLGVNYVDSAFGYCNYESQVAVGKALKGCRDRVFLSTKNPEKSGDGEKWWSNLMVSLERLQESHIDFYHFHGLRWDAFTGDMAKPGGPLERMQRAQDQGLVKHRCFSCHDTPENMIKIIDSGFFDGMLLQYNLLDRANEPAIARAHEKGMGVVVMGPVGGGRLAGYSEQIRAMVPGGEQEAKIPALALRFVLSNPGVTIALSGMTKVSDVEENVRTVSDARLLDESEWSQVTGALERLKEHAKLYCTGCGYCLPCPHGVNIPRNFSLMNYYRVYGLKDYARAQYAGMQTEKPADEAKRPNVRASGCQACKACLEKCPQHIAIIEQLKEVDAALGGK